jgi:competence protein ComEA
MKTTTAPDYKLRSAVLLLSAILFSILAFRSHRNTSRAPVISPAPILLELKGDIPGPGLYLFDGEKTTIATALARAGWTGALPDSLADRKPESGQSLTLLNRDRPEITISSMPAAARLAAALKLDLNTASVDDLLLIPKMRLPMAASIVKRREAKAWTRVDELREIRGIGPKTARKLEDYLEVVPTR